MGGSRERPGRGPGPEPPRLLLFDTRTGIPRCDLSGRAVRSPGRDGCPPFTTGPVTVRHPTVSLPDSATSSSTLPWKEGRPPRREGYEGWSQGSYRLLPFGGLRPVRRVSSVRGRSHRSGQEMDVNKIISLLRKLVEGRSFHPRRPLHRPRRRGPTLVSSSGIPQNLSLYCISVVRRLFSVKPVSHRFLSDATPRRRSKVHLRDPYVGSRSRTHVDPRHPFLSSPSRTF